MSSVSATRTGQEISLWLGVLGGAVAWTAHLLVSYALVSVACANGLEILIHVATVVTALLTVAAGVVCGWIWWQAGLSRARHWMGIAGMLMNGLFLFAIVLEGLPSFLLNPCW